MSGPVAVDRAGLVSVNRLGAIPGVGFGQPLQGWFRCRPEMVSVWFQCIANSTKTKSFDRTFQCILGVLGYTSGSTVGRASTVGFDLLLNENRAVSTGFSVVYDKVD